jgi:hypothetical protein
VEVLVRLYVDRELRKTAGDVSSAPVPRSVV